MGSSFGEVVEGWVGIVGGKFLCIANGANLLCVVDVGSWRFFLSTFKEFVVTPNNLCNGLI